MTSLFVADGLVLSPLEPDDGDSTAQWVSMLQEAAGQGAGATPVCPTDALGSLQFAPPDTVLDDWVLRSGDRVVGSLRLALVEGNDVVRIDELLVHPSDRRRGLGAHLHRHALDRAAHHGRSTVKGSVAEPLPGVAAGKDSGQKFGGAQFAAALGARRASGPAGLRQLLEIAPENTEETEGAEGTEDTKDTEGAEDTAGTPPDGYQLVTWGTVTPDEWAWPVSVLERTLGEGTLTALDAVTAQDQLGQSSYARRFERMRIGRGRRAYHTGVIHGRDPQLVGYTSISMTTSNPHHALQGMTVVQAEHRGYALGLLLKKANLDRVRRREPALRHIETTTDDTNAPMIALNLTLGYRPDERRVTWQQTLSDSVR